MSDDLTCTGCGEYAGSLIADRIKKLEAKLGEYNLLWQAYELDKVIAELKGQNDD